MEQKRIMELETRGEVLVVRFAAPAIGAATNLEAIGHDLRDMIQKKQPAFMIIDFTRVSFFSSQMLGLLVDVWRRLKDCGGTVVISGINPNLTRVFRITSLDKVFDFYPDTDTALQALARPAEG
ncbi:MAG: STAS domain-containing protein [Sedimentisphaerales bacterium]|nr:STAS domain-containing protein [Sedimentisphaerales bacterium]